MATTTSVVTRIVADPQQFLQGFQLAEQSADRLAARLNNVNFSGFNRQTMGMMTAVYALQRSFRAAAADFEVFGNTLSKIANVAGQSITSIRSLAESVRDVSHEYGIMRTELMKGMYRASQQGFTTPGAMRDIGVQAARMSMASGHEIGVSQSADLLSTLRNSLGIGSAFVRSGKLNSLLLRGRDVGRWELNQMAETLGKVTPTYGQEFKGRMAPEELLRQLMSMMGAATKTGLPLNMVATGTRRFLERSFVLASSNRGKELRDVLGREGYGNEQTDPITDALHKLGPMRFAQLLGKLSGGETGRLFKMGYMTRDIAALTAMLNKGGREMDYLYDELSPEATEMTSRKYIKQQQGTWKYQRERLASGMNMTAQSFVESALPAMTAFTTALDKLGSVLQSLPDSIKQLIAISGALMLFRKTMSVMGFSGMTMDTFRNLARTPFSNTQLQAGMERLRVLQNAGVRLDENLKSRENNLKTAQKESEILKRRMLSAESKRVKAYGRLSEDRQRLTDFNEEQMIDKSNALISLNKRESMLRDKARNLYREIQTGIARGKLSGTRLRGKQLRLQEMMGQIDSIRDQRTFWELNHKTPITERQLNDKIAKDALTYNTARAEFITARKGYNLSQQNVAQAQRLVDANKTGQQNLATSIKNQQTLVDDIRNPKTFLGKARNVGGNLWGQVAPMIGLSVLMSGVANIINGATKNYSGTDVTGAFRRGTRNMWNTGLGLGDAMNFIGAFLGGRSSREGWRNEIQAREGLFSSQILNSLYEGTGVGFTAPGVDRVRFDWGSLAKSTLGGVGAGAALGSWLTPIGTLWGSILGGVVGAGSNAIAQAQAMRGYHGHTGIFTQNLYKQPGNMRLRKFMEKHGYNPKSFYEEMGILKGMNVMSEPSAYSKKLAQWARDYAKETGEIIPTINAKGGKGILNENSTDQEILRGINSLTANEQQDLLNKIHESAMLQEEYNTQQKEINKIISQQKDFLTRFYARGGTWDQLRNETQQAIANTGSWSILREARAFKNLTENPGSYNPDSWKNFRVSDNILNYKNDVQGFLSHAGGKDVDDFVNRILNDMTGSPQNGARWRFDEMFSNISERNKDFIASKYKDLGGGRRALEAQNKLINVERLTHDIMFNSLDEIRKGTRKPFSHSAEIISGFLRSSGNDILRNNPELQKALDLFSGANPSEFFSLRNLATAQNPEAMYLGNREAYNATLDTPENMVLEDTGKIREFVEKIFDLDKSMKEADEQQKIWREALDTSNLKKTVDEILNRLNNPNGAGTPATNNPAELSGE